MNPRPPSAIDLVLDNLKAWCDALGIGPWHHRWGLRKKGRDWINDRTLRGLSARPEENRKNRELSVPVSALPD